MAGQEFKAKEKLTQKMSRDGLLEENLSTGEVKMARNSEYESRIAASGKRRFRHDRSEISNTDTPSKKKKRYYIQKPQQGFEELAEKSAPFSVPEQSADTAKQLDETDSEERASAADSTYSATQSNSRSALLRERTYVHHLSHDISEKEQRPWHQVDNPFGEIEDDIHDIAGLDDLQPEIKQKIKKKQVVDAQKKAGRLLFEDETGMVTGQGMGFGKKSAGIVTTAVVSTVHHQIQENEDDNAALEAADRGEIIAEQLLNNAERTYAKRMKSHSSKVRIQVTEPAYKSGRLLFTEEEKPAGKLAEDAGQAVNELQHLWQKKQYQKAYTSAKQGKQIGSDAAKATSTVAEKIRKTVKEFFTEKGSPARKVIALILVLIFFMMASLQSCSVMSMAPLVAVTATTWPASDEEITNADACYSRLEAQLQVEINNMERTHSDCAEFYYNLAPIGHDPTSLISYLSAKYGDFTLNQVRSELDSIFAAQYQLDVQIVNETRTTTHTVQVGDSLGTVVTSAYCSCRICCGQWSGGPTASGVYPQANHTLAVDAYNPIVHMGTELIINGQLYKVEDTGNLNRYGVDFDVYFDDHNEALRWGHKTFEAYYAGGGNGQTIEITESEIVKICYVTLNTSNFEGILQNRMNQEQQELYSIYMEARGNRVMFGTPFAANWQNHISQNFGYYAGPTGVIYSDHMEVTLPRGTEILSVLDGTVKTISGSKIILEDKQGHLVQFTGCSNIQVVQGMTIAKGDVIARVGGTGIVKIWFAFNNEIYNPYFYLDTVSSSFYTVNGATTVQAQKLINEAMLYLGTPYVWGGYSPSGFDCSGFVSYVINHCGAGWDYGRMTAEALRQRVTQISMNNARPGDLIFFQGTYNTSGASHCGIYLGNGEMIHCGNPVNITSLDSSYWQQHLLCFGRLN